MQEAMLFASFGVLTNNFETNLDIFTEEENTLQRI